MFTLIVLFLCFFCFRIRSLSYRTDRRTNGQIDEQYA